MRLGVVPVAVASVLFFAAAVRAGPIIFKWVDKHGDLHVTDRLGDVPEPYFSMYAARLKTLAEQDGAKAAVRAAPVRRASAEPEAPPATREAPEGRRPGRAETARGPSAVDAAIQERERWRQLVAHWRRELELATAAYEKAQADADAARLNPVLVQTPQGKEKVAQTGMGLEKARDRLEKARTMLLVEIPAKAKREQVPPKWLE